MATVLVRRAPDIDLMSRRVEGHLRACTVAILALSIESSVEAALGGNKLLLVVPIGAFVGLGLFVLGLVNFENFVFTTIAIRASLDITKTGAGNGGTSGVEQCHGVGTRARPHRRSRDPLHPRRVLLAAHANARGPEVTADVDPPGLPDPLRARRIPQRHRLRKPERQPARGDPSRWRS